MSTGSSSGHVASASQRSPGRVIGVGQGNRIQQQELIERATRVLSKDDRVQGVWLTGSHARGTSDEFSDVDLWIVMAAEDIEEFCNSWSAIADQIAPTVLLQRVGGLPIFNHVTPDWLRFDVSVTSRDEVTQRTTSTAVPLYDPSNLSASLAAPGPALRPDPQRVQGLGREFLRVLGLLPVVIGRHEYVVGASGANLLRTMLIQLMVEDSAVEDRGGALHLAPLLPVQRMSALVELPAIVATRESVIDAHLACAALFLPLAREMHDRCELSWPTALEEAARRHIESSLSLEVPASPS